MLRRGSGHNVSRQSTLLQNHDPESHEYSDYADQIHGVLIRGNHSSHKDIKISLGFAIKSLAAQPGHKNVHKLHAVLRTKYGSNDASGAA